jgi:mRNA interferase YafQ
MYRIYRTKSFEKSYRKLKESGKLKTRIKDSLERAIDLLISVKKLPVHYKDHALKGEMGEYRECHVAGDILLVYQLRKRELILILVDINSHSELFG